MTQKYLNFFFLVGRPLSPIYGKLMEARASLYEKKICRVRKAPCPVISVGNLTIGGTGKTSHVITLALHLLKKGICPAIVSRGYGGRAGKGPLVVTNGRKILVSPKEAGDEPVMLASLLSRVPVIVGSDRFAGCKRAYREFQTDIILLDDGFQRLNLHRDLDIVLLSALKPFGNGRLFPGGELREPVSALKRASVILLTKAEAIQEGEGQLKKNEVHALFPKLPVFISKNITKGISTLNGRLLTGDELRGKKFFAFSGIASPWHFLENIEHYGVELTGDIIFSDHHHYKASDMKKIMETALARHATGLITTHKDAVKIKPLWDNLIKNARQPMSLHVLEIESRPEDGFWQYLEGRLDYLY
jgi:tetraacyldisaccharide 4'-kinase